MNLKIKQLIASSLILIMVLLQSTNLTVLGEYYLQSSAHSEIVNEEGDTIKNIFPDENLAKLIAMIFYADVDQFIEFEKLQNYDQPLLVFSIDETTAVKSIEGIQHFTSVPTIYLYNNEISDLAPLRNLVNLSALTIYGNKIDDLSALSGLVGLETLWLESNEISDIAPLSNLVNLLSLYLYNNRISDISPISNLVNLSSLQLSNNEISDVSPISSLVNLSYLYLADNEISDVSPISSLVNLSSLHLNDNKISDLRPLGNMELPYASFINQTIELEEANVLEVVRLNIFNTDGSFPNFIVSPNLGNVSRGNLLVWTRPGKHTVEWISENNGFTFSGVAHQQVHPR